MTSDTRVAPNLFLPFTFAFVVLLISSRTIPLLLSFFAFGSTVTLFRIAAFANTKTPNTIQ